MNNSRSLHHSRSLRTRLRRTASSILYGMGATGWLRSTSTQPWRILTYHRVLRAKDCPWLIEPGMFVTPESFETQMTFLKKQAQVISLESLISFLNEGKTIYPGTVAITFDDGWADNFVNAAPILRGLQLPATFFLATGYIETSRWFWTDKIAFFLRHFLSNPSPPPLLAEHSSLAKKVVQTFQQYPDPAEGLSQVLQSLKQLSTPQCHALVDELFTLGNLTTPSEPLFLNWGQIREMASSGFTFGSHSHEHAPIPELSRKEIEADYRASSAAFRQNNIPMLNIFCYPGGYWSEDSQQVLAVNGVRDALVTEGFRAKQTTEQPRLLSRINVHEDVAHTEALFSCRLWLSGF